MTKGIRIAIFDNELSDLQEFERALTAAGCEIKAIDNSRCEGIVELLADFEPAFCIVDCEFEFLMDGAQIIRTIQSARPGLPVIVCSQFLDDEGERKRVAERYKNLPGVCALIGKKPFPTAAELMRRAGFSEGESR